MTGLSNMLGCTIARTHVCTLISSDGTNSTSNFGKAFLGIGVYSEGMDNGDFPDLSVYNGDWLAYECFSYQMPGAIDTVVNPTSAAFSRTDYRSMRKIDSSEMPVLVMQQDHGSAIVYRLQVSYLVLLP